jgi:hypothetical protein
MPELTPGISASCCTAGSTAAPGPVPAPGPVVPSASTPQAAGIAAMCSLICCSSSAISASSILIMRRSELALKACSGPNRMPVNALTSAACLLFIGPRA